MKKLILVLLATFSLIACITDKKNDLQKFNLQGNVKSITEVEDDIKKDSVIHTSEAYPQYITLLKFNEKGNLTKMSFYHSKNILASETLYKYNDKGYLIEEEHHNYDFFFPVSSKHIPKYDDKGNLIEKDNYDSDGKLTSKTKYKYDGKGNEIERNIYKPDGSLDSKWTFKYDNKGNTIEENVYNSNGSLNSKITYRYNDKNIIEEAYNGRNKETYKYEHDDKGNWIKRISYVNNQPNIITKRTIEYY